MTTRTWTQRLSAALAAVALAALAACGGGGSGGSEPAATSPAEPVTNSALECQQANYPCRWSAVDPAVAEQSNRLGDELLAKIDAGVPTADAVAWLQSQATLAELQFDDRKIRFRLPGGRAVWAAAAGSLSAPTAAPASQAQHHVAALQAGRATAQRVIRPGATKRHALVLAPYAYEHEAMVAQPIADILGSMPDYSGRVELLQNLAKTDIQVEVANFRGWDAYDVIYVTTHGGEICWDVKTGIPYHECKASVAAQESNDPLVDAIEDDNVGVELIKYEGGTFLSVTTDFFRHEYPTGLDGKLVYLIACSSWNTQLAAAIPGATGVYAGWAGEVISGHGQQLAQEMFTLLAQGLDMKEVLEIVADDLEIRPGVRLHTTDRHLRIRDLISVTDAYTGAVLSDDSGIDVGFKAGDGLPDHMLLAVFLDGIRPEIADAYRLDVLLGSQGLASYPVGARAQQVGPYRWKMELEVPLGIDAQPGQVLPLQFGMQLPGWGVTFIQPSPKVNAPVEVAEQWSMTSTTVHAVLGGTTTKTAHVIWEIEPDTAPDARYRYFRVKSGSMTIVHDSDVAGCRLSYQATVEIAPGEANNSLKFDMGNNPPLFTGYGNAKGDTITANRSCEDGTVTPTEIKVGGVYLYAKDLGVSDGTSFQGHHHDGAQMPTTIDFQFSRQR